MYFSKRFLLFSLLLGTVSARIIFPAPDRTFNSLSWRQRYPSDSEEFKGMDNPVNHLVQNENSDKVVSFDNPVNHFNGNDNSSDDLKAFMRPMDNPVNHLVQNENSEAVVGDNVVTGNSFRNGKKFDDDGHKHHFKGDGHIHEFNDDGHVLHFNGDGHKHQLNEDVRSFSGNGYTRKLNNDNHNHHFNGDGDNHRFNDNGHVLHFNGDGHLHSLNDEQMLNGNNQRQLSGAFLYPPPKSMNHIVKAPLDDDDLSLVQETFQDQTINKTGQLRYSTLPIVEKALIKDIVRIILKDEEYMILLNNPSFPEVVNMVRTMLREPTQDVLQKQIWSKVLAIEAYYKKFYQPLTNPDNKREAMNFLTHLKEASDEHKLTVDDTVKLNEKMQILAFLIQEKEFNQRISDLEATITEGAGNVKEKNYSRKSAVNKKSSDDTYITAPTGNPTTVITTTMPSNARRTSLTPGLKALLSTSDDLLTSSTNNSTTTEFTKTETNATITSNTKIDPIPAVSNLTTTESPQSTDVTMDSKREASTTGFPIRRNFAENFNPYVGGPESVRDSWKPEETDEGDDY
ncbi:hypothetical protein B9Z55_025589 [Caenorhabditis nigoni]|uniref:SXP/RAL-2 family protein Ani s 5-like cation-binding domain-containing protein n=1 Tax=Caenorhabditis nigoni TaxID=1611254 RepID=A0A2G5SZT2_9PELO|nr:hypothetical protein B9Z55_025589 [Caenorhabditis nigoni]